MTSNALVPKLHSCFRTYNRKLHRLEDSILKAKTKVITNGCTTGQPTIEQTFGYIESQENKKIGTERMILTDLQRKLV